MKPVFRAALHAITSGRAQRDSLSRHCLPALQRGYAGPDVYRPDNVTRRAAPRFDDYLRNQSPAPTPSPGSRLYFAVRNLIDSLA